MRSFTYRHDPCLAHIVDREDGTWEANRYNGGSYWRPGTRFDTSRSYGLPQANPGTKMRSAGADWLTNPWTQLRWAVAYARERYGSTCAAWLYWQRHYQW